MGSTYVSKMAIFIYAFYGFFPMNINGNIGSILCEKKFDLHVVYPAVQTNEGHVIEGTDIAIPLCTACAE